MARIAGVDIPRDKRIEVSLTYIYGVGLTRSQAILAKTGVNPDIRVKDLEDGDLQKLRNAMEEYNSKAICAVRRAWPSSACRTSAASVAVATA